ncbi:MAG: hypothetical protein ACHRXM_24915 [Isosphaerales bacterium]
MPRDHSARTSTTLLGRLRHDPSDQAAWSDFVARYRPKILQMKVARVYVAKSEVKKMIREEIRKLEGAE